MRIWFLLLCILTSCYFLRSDNYKRPLLNKKERDLYIVNYGWNMLTEHKLAFIEGKILPGMKTEFVLQMYGEPDLVIPCPKRQNLCDEVWQYQSNDDHVIGSVSIKNSVIIRSNGQMKDPCKF